jgi:DNA-binding winged helix-turn-helix (wHTH) protein
MSTPQSSPAGRVVRFGVFEVDLSAGELRKTGRRVRLQEQPFQLLALLLERPGELVTRDEVRQKLWAADTFVDFDHSLNTAIKKVREALGDSASSPRFVETIARRGYRFLAPLNVESRNQFTDPDSVAHDSSSPAIHPELDVPLPRRAVTRGLFALIQVMYLSFYVVALFLLHDIDLVTQSFRPGWGSAIQAAVVVTAGVGIPLRFYLLSSTVFDHRRLGDNFLRMFPVILALDQLWAVAPFLTSLAIGFGAAFAATAALLYVPFAERTLVKMAYPRNA